MRWEYKVDEGEQVTKSFDRNDLQVQLEKRGNEGWELVSSLLYQPEDEHQRIFLIFKRPIPPKKVRVKKVK